MKKLFLLLIIILAAFLRFWQLGVNPPALTWDEVSFGYNAYSLGIDGKDEFGKFLPIQYLESFGDFKPPLYAYLNILPVKIFGLTEFATRFPSALFGTLTVLMTYFLGRRLTLIKTQKDADSLALLSSFFLAISPWHINLSRAAFEANVASFFIVSGIWLFLAGVQEKKWCLIFSAFSFVLSMYTFNTARIVAPLLVLALAIGFRKKLWENKKHTFSAGIIGLILFLPLIQFLFSPQASLRFHEVNIFSDSSIVERSNREIKNDGGVWWSKIIHNRRIYYAQSFISHYLDHFNPAFLFIKGDGNPKFSTQDVGQLYLAELPFLIIGAFFLFKKREGHWWILPMWLMIGIIPAATARETPHALRIETTLPVWQILTALGFLGCLSYLRTWRLPRPRLWLSLARRCATCFAMTILFLNFLYYVHGYYTYYPVGYSQEWQYGYKEAVNYVKEVENQYDKIVFTDNLGRPYIYFLFYTRENPRNFQATAKIWREALGFVHVDGYGKYEFQKEIKPEVNKKNLYVGLSQNVPSGVHILKTFNYLNGQPVLAAYTL